MKYEDIRSLLKNYIMDTYDIRPSLAEKTVEEMFKKGAEFISKEEQKEILEDGNDDCKTK